MSYRSRALLLLLGVLCLAVVESACVNHAPTDEGSGRTYCDQHPENC